MCACVLSRFSHVRLCAILWTIAQQAPLSMGFSKQEYWSELPVPSPGDPLNPGTAPASLCLLPWQVGSLPLVSPGKPMDTQNSPQDTAVPSREDPAPSTRTQTQVPPTRKPSQAAGPTPPTGADATTNIC